MPSCSGKRGRLSRLIHPTYRRATILALDHGFTMGPVPGLERIGQRLQGVGRDALDAVVVHQGMVERLMPLFEGAHRPGLIVHLSGATQLSPSANEKRLVCTVEHALRLGADGVSVHANLGAKSENQMLVDLAAVSQACQHWGVPLLAMMYPRPDVGAASSEPRHVAHAVRIAMEVGADLVKVPYTGTRESFARVLEDVDIPVFVAGGAKVESDEELLRFVDDALQAGAAGVTFGRNIFQSAHPVRIARAVASMVHSRFSLEEALAVLADEQLVSEARTAGLPRDSLQAFRSRGYGEGSGVQPVGSDLGQPRDPRVASR
ncbi:MAG TPA: 2-amino-3,7-dideoxy-D-threo-hept-6-ulosonate synthase [Polyangiaceae bacterium]|nr:2-amino-3,7-dideoxy-D-threo-hept-6-ulosonate synthase [Polyangiaceae bacterium]